jgi:integrase
MLCDIASNLSATAECTGLRAEEVLALEWQDIDFEDLSMKVVRAVVHGRVKMVKTEYSEDELPLDPDFSEFSRIQRCATGNRFHRLCGGRYP